MKSTGDRADFCGDGGATEDYYGVCLVFLVINFTSRCNRKGRILTSVTRNLSGLEKQGIKVR